MGILTVTLLAFITGYAVIWLIIYFVTKSKTDALNHKLHRNT